MKIILLTLRRHIGAVASSGSFFPFVFLFFLNSVMVSFEKAAILYCSVYFTAVVRETIQKRLLEDTIYMCNIHVYAPV